MKHLRTRIRGDGTLSDAPIFFYPLDPETGKPFDGDTPEKPGVGIQLRHIPPPEHQDIVQASTRHRLDPETKAWTETIDHVAISNTVCQTAIVAWWGLDTEDGAPLLCSDEAKRLFVIPRWRSEIQWLALRTFVAVEVAAQAASF